MVSAQNLAKAFSGVPALRDASVEVAGGEVVAVMGENGAGKSTLMKILSGSLARDSGTMTVPDKIGMVHQEAMLAPHLSVAENLFLGREPLTAGFFLDNRETVRLAARYLEKHRLALDPRVKTGSLNAAQKQMLELARALRGDPDLLILDEPTSSLSEAGSREVLAIVEECRKAGKAILYISHRFEEVRAAASRVMVLRDGATVFSGELRSLSDAELVKHMAGHAPVDRQSRAARARGEVLLESGGVTLHSGEIVGLAGLMGAGRTEFCQELFGVAGRGSPRKALASGLVYLSEDRQHFGILQGRGLRENITIATLGMKRGGGIAGPAGILDLGREQATASAMIKRLAIRGASSQSIETLSGGNQQKALLARWMLTGARVFLLDEPTRGIDVNAKEEVFALMADLAAQGAAVLMVSSEIEELLRVCDRLLVMRQNKIVRELDPASATREEVLHWAF